jgi:hypothetical protein
LLGPPDHHVIEPLRVLGVLAFYAAIFLIVQHRFKRRIEPEERKTFLAVAAVWAVSVFVANYLLYLADQMSFLPWINNFMHTFIWIGVILAWLYLGIRDDEPMWFQFLVFAFFSLIVKGCEQILFGTWDKDEVFFGLLHGNGAYVMFWSIADGLYPILTLWGLRLAAKRIPGLMPT